MAWEVSTLPATTAAGGSGASIEPGGTTMRSGRRQPSLSGMSSSTRVRKTYRTAALTTANGALKLVASCGDVPVKSTVARALRAVHGDPDADDGARVGLVGELAVLQGVDDAAHGFLGVVLDVLHVRLDDVEPEVVDHAGDFVDALLVGGDLGAQVGEVGVRVARRVRGRR